MRDESGNHREETAQARCHSDQASLSLIQGAESSVPTFQGGGTPKAPQDAFQLQFRG